jgi:hypothetical protein
MEKIRLLSLNDLLLRDAADLANGLHPEIPLRTLDALHLATFLSVEAGPLFTKDARMVQAAAKMGLPSPASGLARGESYGFCAT